MEGKNEQERGDIRFRIFADELDDVLQDLVRVVSALVK